MSFDSDGTLLWPFPKQKAWCAALCCDLERWDKVHAFSPYTESPSFAYFPHSSLRIKDISVYFSIDPHPFQDVFFFSLLLLSFPTIFSNIIFFKSLHSKVCVPSFLPLPSCPTQYPISFPLPCLLCTIFIMTDWWVPLQHLSANTT